MTQINPKKRESIKNTITDIFNNTILNKYTASFKNPDYVNFEKLAKEISKNNDFQIDQISSMFLYLDSIQYYNKFICPMQELPFDIEKLETEEKNKFIDFICDFYLKFPFPYSIKVPLNHLELPNYSEGEKISIVYNKLATATRGFGVLGSSNIATTNVVIPSIGYYSIYEKEYFIKETTLSLNVLIYALRENQIINRNRNKSIQNAMHLSPVFEKRHQIIDHTAIIINDYYPAEEDEYSFPIPYAKFLSELEMCDDMENLAFQKKALETIKETNKLLGNESIEAKNIVSAIDWCVQSEINLDMTMGFIQSCMGIEALLGDNSNEAGLTLTLTDRCAYLIGKGMTERSEIKKDFKAIYQLRSKLVHGRVNKISPKDRVLCGKATKYLKRAIQKELTHLFE
ncbi:hypothetical protein [Citrobacter europaeus]|uniref:hypothetical protein n=1 Tax=Citrobacter europaeus TaxID=1914243 RepID=UPI00397DCFCC